MYSRRSASVGALPREKKHYVSRNESGSGISLDVRCACQYFQSDSLMPERAQPSVDSRPSSKLGLHAEIIDHSELLAWPDQTMHDFRPMNYMDAQRPTATAMEAERLSMHSSGVITAPPPPVDLSFLERYPELEETARKRKLIVRSISNASDDVMRESSVGGAAGMRFRQTSESGMDFDTLSMRSGTSVRRISRSPSKADLFIADIILPSSTQQHTPYDNYRQPRSASATRRSSNADTTHFGPAAGYVAPVGRSRQPTPAYLSSSPTRVPEINLISPTPAVTGADVPPEFPQAAAQRATPDYRNVRPKPSVDYMRPSESNEFLFRTVDGVMPQNRPIDMSRYGKDTLVAKPTPTPTTHAQDTSLSTRNLSPTREALGVSTQSAFRVPSREATPNRNLSPTREALAVSSQSAFRVPSREATPNRNLSPTREALALSSQSAFRVPSREGSPFEIQLSRSREASPMPASVKSLEDTVAELEEFVAEHNLVEIVDTIQASTKEPPRPTFEQHPTSAEALQLGSNTEINIVTTVPIVDIDELVQQEVEKAAQQQQHPRPPPRHLSPPAKRPHSPTPMSTLQLPIAGSPPKMDTTETSTAEQRTKRAASPAFLQVSPARTKHLPETQLMEMHTVTISGPLQEASPEAKSTYAARFKSMFTSKGNGSSPRRQRSPSPSPVRQKSPSASPMREKSPTPMREKSPTPNKSPSPNRATKLTAMFSKIKPTQIEVVNSSNSVKPKKPEAEPLSVKVTETFSLKVDEMDQYCTQPPKPPQLPPTAQSAYSSRDDFLANSERVSVDIADAFAPVVIGSSNRQSFLAGNRTMYSSDIDVRPKRLSTDFQYSSKEMSIGSSTPISHSKPALFSAPINIPTHPHAVTAQHHLGHSMLEHKPTFISERTQSHDRAQRVSGSSDDLFKSRMTKTVSFNFDERQSRLSEFKSRSPSSQQAVEKTEFLDRTYFSRDHDYEPIGEPAGNEAGLKREASPMPISQAELTQSTELNILSAEIKEAADLQKELEDRYFTQTAAAQQEADEAAAATERSLAEAEDMESPEDEAPKAEKRGFMATAQDHTRRMQTGIKNQATKIKTRLRPVPKKPVSGSPKSKKKERFKAPQFSKIKMPAIKKPDMSKIKDFKRPEFTKFSKPDMTKFKLPERLTTLKLKRSHSLKHEDINDNELSTQSPDSQPATDNQPQKKTFEFNFGTYPRAFRKKKKPVEPESPFGTEGTSIQPSNTTQPSFESSSSPQGDRGPGPVRSRWADKFSDVSYNDSEGSRYRRYGSEQESFDKESSLERRMKDDLEESASEINEMGILGGRVGETKQFAEFDEENRAIHEISNLRSGEFKRRPMVHQDSDLRSEDSKDAEGWTDKDIQRNKLLRKAEMEAEASFLKYHAEDGQALDNRSMASSTGRKVVMEEIDDDEFFLRKRGISEDNIELRQYISSAIREGYDTPLNALQNVGQTTEPPMEFGDYDVPPPKPRRLHKGYRPQDDSQEYDLQRSDYGDDFSVSQNGSDFFMVPKKPLRKDRSRSKYSMDSEIPMADERTSREQYFDNDEDYLRPPNYDANDLGMNDLSFSSKQQQEDQDVGDVGYPQPPRRQKRRMREGSQEKDSLINGLSGKSVSSSFLQQPKDVIVYRTEHEYHIPIATTETYTDDASTSTHKSRSASRYDEDDRTSSHGAQSFHMNDDAKENIDYNGNSRDDQSKFIIDMMENDGYAIVRKEHMPKPTPPARRKRFARSPGERFATLPNMRTKRGTPPPERPPPPRSYVPSVEQSTPPVRQSSHSLDAPYNIDDDYEEPETLDRPESPRNLQSGEIINRMKYRPLPAPPRPPREKRQRSDLKSSLQTAGTTDEESAIEYADSEDTEQRGTASELEEVEAATQTDPLPDNYEVAELEITDSMRIIEPRRRAKTIEELLQEELAEKKDLESSQAQDEDEQLTRGLQRFREANQRSLSERSRASSSQADRSKSLSRPQTPSAVVVESRVSTPSPYTREVAVLEASLLVKPLDDLDLEEAELRREGLLSDSSQQSKSDIEKEYKEYEEKYKQDERKLFVDDLSNAPSSTELNVTDYEQRLRSFDERDMSQSEQEQEQEEGEEKTAAEATLSDLEAEIEARYRKLYSRDLELDSKQFSQEEEDESKLLKSDYESEDDYRAQQQTETATEEYTVEQADETVEEKVKEIEKEAEVEVEQPFEKVVTKDTVDAAFTPSNLTTKQETEQEIREASPTVEEQPLPPPRRKSTTNIEQPAVPAPAPTLAEPTATTMTVAEVAPVAAPTTTTVVQMPSSVSDLAVERLHVHALQAGQIMVSQMHGAHISSDQLECNTANLVVNNIQLPPGFIEDIVERVHRSTDSRPTTLLTVETQTSQTASSEDLPKEGSPIPPKKPARQKQLESQQADTAEMPPPLQHQQQQQSQHKNPDEQTQTDPIDPMLSNLPPLYPTAEYLQSLAPLAFYNMHRAAAPSDSGERLAGGVERSESMQRRRRPYRRHSSSSGGEEPEDLANANEKQHTHRRRTRSSTQPPEAQPPTIRQAATQFLSACSLSLVNIINQLTDYVRSDDKKVLGRTRQVPTLVALFVVITFVLLLFLLSGKNVHTHHWDFFNLPGNEARK